MSVSVRPEPGERLTTNGYLEKICMRMGELQVSFYKIASPTS